MSGWKEKSIFHLSARNVCVASRLGGVAMLHLLREKEAKNEGEKGEKGACEHTQRPELGISIRFQGSAVLGARVAVIC